MKKIIFLGVFTIICAFSSIMHAQVSLYSFTQTSGTYTPITGGTVVAEATATSGAGGLDDLNFSAQPIPFTFLFNGTGYTEYNINTNGYITFGATLPAAGSPYTPISNTAAYNGAISGIGRDLWGAFRTNAGARTSGSPVLTGVVDFTGIEVGQFITGTGIPGGSTAPTTTIDSFDAGAGTITMSANATSTTTTAFAITMNSGEIRSETIGAAGSQVHIIQFKNFARFAGANEMLNFQIRLYETSNKIEIVYGSNFTLNTTSAAPQVGLRGLTNTDFNNRTSTTDWAATTSGVANTETITLDNSVFPPSGLTFEWTSPNFPPSIAYIPLLNTTTTGNRTLSVQLNDPDGIATGANAPRIYWRVNTGSWQSSATTDTSNPYNFTIGTTGLTAGDVVEYYVVAQDVLGAVGANPSAGFVASDVNNVSSPPTTPESYLIIGPPLAGDYLIGVGGAYTTLTAAVTDLNLRGVSAAVNFLLTDATYNISETFPIEVNISSSDLPTASMPVIIRPNTGVVAVISGTSTSSILAINGIDYINIDGSNSGGTDRSLTIENTSTAANTAVIRLISQGEGLGASNNIIKNTVIRAGSRTVTSAFGIYIGGTAITTTGTGATNNNNLIENNVIERAYYGIYASGATGTGMISHLTIQNNSIGSSVLAEAIGNRGIRVANAEDVMISENEIFGFRNSSTTIQTTGVEFSSNVVNSIISKNMIYDLFYTGSTNRAGQGISVNSVSGANVEISNNVIYGLKGHSSTTTLNNSWGIMLLGGSNYDVYYNSINITETFGGTATNIHGGVYVASTVSTINLLNNNIASQGANGVFYHVYSLASAAAYTNINHNNYFKSGTVPASTTYHVGFMGSARTNLSDWRTATGQDMQSISADPLFVSPTELAPTAGSPVLGAGTPILGISTTDIIGATRDATAPTIGAYEDAQLCPQPLNLAVTNFTANSAELSWTENGTALLWDIEHVLSGVTPSGTPTHPGVTNPYVLGGLTPLTEYDYYVRSDCGGNGVSDWSGPFTFITGCVAPLAGTYTIGATGDFDTITEAVTALNICGVSAAVTFLLIDANYPSETFPIMVNVTSTNVPTALMSVTFRPDTGVVAAISGTSSSSILAINGTSHININGSNSGGTDRSLTIENSSTSANTAAIQLISPGTGMGATNNTISNCIIVTGEIGTTTSLHTFGIYIGGTTITNTATGSDNDNNTISNNIIKKARYGIYARGASVADANDNLMIIDNEIGSNDPAEYVTFRGIDITNADGALISGNYIHDMKITLSASNAGIDFGVGVSNSEISGNTITGIYSESTNGWGAYGINLSSGTNVTNNSIINNVISDIRGVNYSASSNAFNAFGIRLTGGTNTKVFYNSVNLFGDITIVSGAPTEPNSAAMVVTATTVTGLEVVNNILVNTQSFVSGTPKTYSIWVPASYAGFLNINYNDYYGNTTPPTTYHVGRVGTTVSPIDYTLLSDWSGFTTQDGNSISANPDFVSPTNLAPQSGSPVIGTGTPISGISTDINGETRDSSAPSIGAYENDVLPGFFWENGTWSPSNAITDAGPGDDITIVNGTATFNANMDINNLYVNSGATLNIENVLKINGDIDNNGSLVFVSNASTTGQLDTFTGNITGSGLVTAQRYIPARRAFRFLSSAVNTTTSINANLQEGATSATHNPNPGFGTHITGSVTGVNGFDATPSGNPSIFELDNPSQQWVALPNTDVITINAGAPVRMMVRGDRSINLSNNNATPTNTTLRITGTMEIGTHTQSDLSNQAGAFNFFGNPYQAIVDMNSVITSSTNINSNFYYVWDPNMGTRGAYVTVSLPGGGNVSGSAANQYLQPGQAAFVSTLNNATATLTFEESHKAVSQPQTAVFNITSKLDIRLYEATAFANNDTPADGLRLKFAIEGINAITSQDALKMYNLDENLATTHNGKLYSLESRAMPQVGENIPLFTNQYRSTGYVFQANLTEVDGVTAYLLDNHTGMETELANNTVTLYPFNVDPNNAGSVSETRFEIIFKEKALGVNNETFGSGFVLFPNPARDNVFFIATNGLEGQNVSVRMYNILGQQVLLESQKVGSNSRLQVNTPGLPAGVYMVTLTAENGNSFTAKLINK